MSGERSVDVEKINNNEKGFEPAHIRSVISLALFSFVFLGMEFFFDSRAAEFVDARSVLLYQSVILLGSKVSTAPVSEYGIPDATAPNSVPPCDHEEQV